ncbi:hypothetical protein N0B51_07875 [Tsuneonella sp. YG55]|uniref:Uncharacterized protein n=1 Tax=Tsuneonella litorea TaxID=2976475 RepID=A0A9X2W2Q4_9SPHN|nr:hypothetical protein [Tsuneonella litorea]MCT2558895.1 hypothetical protein [Tsuneonella litorea]
MSGARTRPEKEPGDGPLADTGPSEIEIERRQAGVEEDEDEGTAVPPEAELPPD